MTSQTVHTSPKRYCHLCLFMSTWPQLLTVGLTQIPAHDPPRSSSEARNESRQVCTPGRTHHPPPPPGSPFIPPCPARLTPLTLKVFFISLSLFSLSFCSFLSLSCFSFSSFFSFSSRCFSFFFSSFSSGPSVFLSVLRQSER